MVDVASGPYVAPSSRREKWTMKGSMTVGKANVPSVDFSPFMVNEGVVVAQTPTQGQLDVAEAIDKACRLHGFLYLTNFGLSREERDDAFAASRQLFALSNETKADSLRRLGTTDNMGYAPYQSESHNPARPPELSEKFGVRFPPVHVNDFRACPESFVASSHLLLRVMKDACRRYALACALALGLDDTHFFAKTFQTMNQCTVRYLHAPPCDFNGTSGTDLDRPLRISEHTDFGAFTFLLLADHGAEGLQIKPVEGGEITGLEAGSWQDVVLPTPSGGANHPGAIVNTGALMARWTNDEWKATAHRVIVASKEMASRDRYSLAFFADPDVKSVIDVAPELLSDGKTKKYEPTTSDGYLLEKLLAMGRSQHSEQAPRDEEKE